MRNISLNRKFKKLATIVTVSLFITMVLVSCAFVPHPHPNSQSAQRYHMDMWDPGWTGRGMWEPDMMGPGQRQRMERHWTFMHSGIPTQYRGQTNPLTPTTEIVQEGAKLYRQQCAACHGPQGMGDGDAGKSLNPSPALLAYMIQKPMSVDEYMMWAIAEGGKQFGTAMPAHKEILTKNDIWKIVTFMRAGFPSNLQ